MKFFSLFKGNRKENRRHFWFFLILSALLVVSIFFGLSMGAYHLSFKEVIEALFSAKASDPAHFELAQARVVLLEIRLPRVILAILVGVGFGMSGSALQALFRNPLADPGLIGVSSGAALGAAMTIVLGGLLFASQAAIFAYLLPLSAFLGALFITFLVYYLALNKGRVALPLLLLAGIAINALVSAVIGLLIYQASDAQLRSITFWNLGSLGAAQWKVLIMITPLVFLSCVILIRQRFALNAMQLGESEALHLGVDVQNIKRIILIATALCIGALVSGTGMIGFIGLVVPHCVRLICGSDQRLVMPGAALLGACFTILADLLSRTLVSPAEIPLGILTALIGGPFFMMLLWKNRQQLGF